MTIKQEKALRLQRAISGLVELTEAIGEPKPVLEVATTFAAELRRLERKAHRNAEIECNYATDEAISERWRKEITQGVFKLFGVKELPGFFINGDPRGYALKIDSERTTPAITASSVTRDWGGYLCLAADL